MAHSHSSAHDNHGSHHTPMYYVKIWGILLVLLIISIIGPEMQIRWLTLITAFGIAIVKALMVAAYFMHLNVEKRYIWYMLYSMMIIIALMFVGLSADVLKVEGSRWENKAAKDLIEAHSGVNKKESHGDATQH